MPIEPDSRNLLRRANSQKEAHLQYVKLVPRCEPDRVLGGVEAIVDVEEAGNAHTNAL